MRHDDFYGTSNSEQRIGASKTDSALQGKIIVSGFLKFNLKCTKVAFEMKTLIGYHVLRTVRDSEQELGVNSYRPRLPGFSNYLLLTI